MGLTESKPSSSQSSREQRERAKAQLVNERKAQLDNIQGEMLSSSLPSSSSTSSLPSSSSTVVAHQKDLVAMIKITEKAKNQLDRGGGPLTKADLVAIIVALQPEMRSQIVKIEAMTTSDLNSTIRGIIYDPSRVIGGSGNHSNNNNNHTYPALSSSSSSSTFASLSTSYAQDAGALVKYV
jgi:hypothetical protein